MSKVVRAVGALCFLTVATAAADAGEFHPGWIYVSATSNKGLVSGDLIWAFDPSTGKSELLGDYGEIGTSDLVFKPDGSVLLDAMYGFDTIGAIDPEKGLSTYLGPADGIVRPAFMEYDRWGNFYVQGGGKVLRFPADGGPGDTFADGADDIGLPGPITVGPTGDLYYAEMESLNRNIIRVTPEGEVSVFATLDQDIYSLETDSAGNLFVLGTSDLFRIDLGDPNSLHVLSTLGGDQVSNVRMSPDETILYWQNANSLRAMDPETGEWQQLGYIPSTPDHYEGTGMAVYVPEPATLALLVALLGAAHREVKPKR